MVKLCPVFYQYMHCTAIMPTLISVYALPLWVNRNYMFSEDCISALQMSASSELVLGAQFLRFSPRVLSW